MEAQQDRSHVTFELKVTPEAYATLKRGYTRFRNVSPGVSWESFLRRMCIFSLEPHLTEYNRFGIAGHRVIWKVPQKVGDTIVVKDEEGVLEVEEPVEFGKAVETTATDAETQPVEVIFPRRFYDLILDAAMYKNSYTREANKRDKISPPRIIYKTVGDWFKHAVFNPAIPLDTKVDLLAMAEGEEGAKKPARIKP